MSTLRLASICAIVLPRHPPAMLMVDLDMPW